MIWNPTTDVLGGLDQVRRQHAGAADQGNLLEAGRVLRLTQDLRSRGDEDREIERLGLFAGDAGQQRMHVDVFRVDRLLRQHRAALRLEVFLRRESEPTRIGAAVVDGHDLVHLEDVVEVLASDLPCSMSL